MKFPGSSITRRNFLWMAAASTAGFAQGVSQRNVKPRTARQTLRHSVSRPLHRRRSGSGTYKPVIYGGIESQELYLRTVGCGVAFFDYDNDGWLDILVLSGTRVGGT